MDLLEVVRTSIMAMIGLSWISIPIASASAFGLGLAFAPRSRRWTYFISAMLGGIAGGFCAICGVFLSLSMWCSHHPQPCNDAQGGIILIFMLPVGIVCSSLLASWWTRLTMKIPEESPWAS